jgi:hypothetical protein
MRYDPTASRGAPRRFVCGIEIWGLGDMGLRDNYSIKSFRMSCSHAHPEARKRFRSFMKRFDPTASRGVPGDGTENTIIVANDLYIY